MSDYIYVSNDSNNDRFLSSYDNWTKETWRFRTLKSDGTTGFLQPVKEDTVIRYDFTLKVNVSDMYFGILLLILIGFYVLIGIMVIQNGLNFILKIKLLLNFGLLIVLYIIIFMVTKMLILAVRLKRQGKILV